MVVAVCVLGVLSLIIVNSVAIPTQTRTYGNKGAVRAIGVGVYWDQACINAVSSIDWGIVNPGSNVNKSIYIRNEGNVAAVLSMSVSGWSPVNSSSYLSLGWNYAGTVLSVNQVISARLTLYISSSITGITNFDFGMTLTANGQK